MTKKLIINCDDFGPNPHVEEALIESMSLGLITSASVITNYKQLDEVKTFHHKYPKISLGIHLNFTSGLPVLPPREVQSLLNKDGNFFRNLERDIKPEELKAEFEAQIHLLSTIDISPSHIDNHHPEIYFHPKLFEVVLTLAKEYDLPVRVPFTPNVLNDIESYSKRFQIPSVLLEEIASSVLDLCSEHKAKYPNFFIGDYTFGNKSKESFIKILDELDDGVSELCVHPATDSPDLIKELRVLTDPDIKNHLIERNIELVSYHDFAHSTDSRR